MARHAIRLTDELLRDISNRIKAGAFDQVAVESLGVPFALFQKWLESGQRKRARRLYRALVEEVRQARAQARLLTEVRLRDEDAKVWLLNGPGRDTPAQAGWGTGSRAGSAAETVAQASIWELCGKLLEALAPFPEARAAAAEALARFQPE